MNEQPVYQAPVSALSPPQVGVSGAMKRTTLIIVTIAVVLGGITVLAVSSMGSATLYRHVQELQANKPRYLKAKIIDVQGYARNVPKEGRIEGEKIYREFELTTIGGDSRIHVIHEGVVPDTFKEMAQTVAKGKLTEAPDGTLVLTTVGGEKGLSAKCPSKYEEK